MIDLNGIDLVCFDLDDTLVAWKTLDLCPGVREWFDEWGDKIVTIIVSNQGGVGLRHWQTVESWGDPEKLPTLEEAVERSEDVRQMLNIDVALNSFAYQAKNGNWAPIPNDMIADMRWRHDWRKPFPGMILYAMQLAQVEPLNTLMVGDRDEDLGAAAAAGVRFIHRDEFFGGSV